MSTSITIAPLRKTVTVNATPERAFEVFTTGIDRWWPKTHGIGSAPVARSIIEPFVGGRWYAVCTDGTEAVVGHVRVWEPGARFVVSWEINALWKSDSRIAFASQVDVRFVAESQGVTRVDLEHRDFERMGASEGDTMRSNVDSGWPVLLEMYAREASRLP